MEEKIRLLIEDDYFIGREGVVMSWRPKRVLIW